MFTWLKPDNLVGLMLVSLGYISSFSILINDSVTTMFFKKIKGRSIVTTIPRPMIAQTLWEELSGNYEGCSTKVERSAANFSDARSEEGVTVANKQRIPDYDFFKVRGCLVPHDLPPQICGGVVKKKFS
jgi:hypothetical protein